MQYLDVTRKISGELPVYPGDPPCCITEHDDGVCRVTEIHMASHTGTHIDAPAHYLRTGATVDQISIHDLTGPVQVMDCREAGSEINAAFLRTQGLSCDRIFLRTAFSEESVFRDDFPHLSPEAAEYLIKKHCRCVGIDSPSVEAFGSDGHLHQALLEAGILVIELLDLSLTKEGFYSMIALPLPITGCDGAPARVLLTTMDG